MGLRKKMEGVGRGLSHDTQDVSSPGSTLTLGMTMKTRVGLISLLSWASDNYLEIGGGGVRFDT